MKQLLITIAAVVLVGCGSSENSKLEPLAKPTSKEDIAFKKIMTDLMTPESMQNQKELDAVERLLKNGANVNCAFTGGGETAFDQCMQWGDVPEVQKMKKLLKKYGGKSGSEF